MFRNRREAEPDITEYLPYAARQEKVLRGRGKVAEIISTISNIAALIGIGVTTFSLISAIPDEQRVKVMGARGAIGLAASGVIWLSGKAISALVRNERGQSQAASVDNLGLEISPPQSFLEDGQF